MKLNWKEYCYTYKLPSSSTKEDAYNHFMKYKLNNKESSTFIDNKPFIHEIFPSSLSYNKNILFLCHTIPTPDLDSGSNRIIEILKILISLDYKIYYLTHDIKPDNPKYLEDLYNLGVTKVYGADHNNQKYCHDYIEELTLKDHIIFNVIIFEFYEMYCAYWDKIQYLVPNIKTIIDTVDVHWIRKLSNPNNTEADIKKIKNEKNKKKKHTQKLMLFLP